MSKHSHILMPKLGLTMTEGKLLEWRVAEGDQVRSGDLLFTVETDKIANEVEARGDGQIIAIKVAEGETVAVGTVLAVWTGPGDGPESPDAGSPDQMAPKASEAKAVVQPPAQKAQSSRVVATPLARRRAKQLGVDLTTVVGRGARGQIKAADVEQAAARIPVQTVEPAGQRTKPSQVQQIIARRLTESKQTIPHFYVLSDADIGRLEDIRQDLKTDAPGGSRVTLNHFLIAALARALVLMPEMNAVWQDGEIVNFDTVDIGIAVDGPRGLVAPVLRNIGSAGILQIAQAAHDLVGRAREGQLSAADLEGGALSVSNVGMFGATALVPIINPGQSAILGVGKPKAVFRPDDRGAPKLCTELSLVLSCDHRLINGVQAAKFLDQVRAFLENPLRLLL